MAVLPRGGGTSQCGQTVGEALVIDVSKYLRHVVDFNAEARTAVVQPGVVLDQLNAFLKPHGLWYPVDVSTSAQATIGGMTGNNSCGSRSIFYGNMVHNVRGVDAVLADGNEYHFGAAPSDLSQVDGPQSYRDLVRKIRDIAVLNAEEIELRYPKLLRRVGGYNLDMVSGMAFNMAHLLVGSEGTLAYFEAHSPKLVRAAQAQDAGRVPLPDLLQVDESAAAHRQAEAGGGGAGGPHHDRPRAQQCPAFRPIVEKFINGTTRMRFCWWSSPAMTRTSNLRKLKSNWSS